MGVVVLDAPPVLTLDDSDIVRALVMEVITVPSSIQVIYCKLIIIISCNNDYYCRCRERLSVREG
jgi:hypothetical protein